MRKRQWLQVVSGALAIVMAVAAVVWVVAPDRAVPNRSVPKRAAPVRATGGMPGAVGGPVGHTGDSAAAEEPASAGPIVLLPDKVDVSPPLADIEPIAAPAAEETLIRFQEIERLPGHDKGSYSGVNSALQGWHGIEAMPTPTQNWDGIDNTGYTMRPPDSQGDVGPNHYVQWVNVRFQIWDKTGTSLYGPAPGNTIWSGMGGGCESYNDGDPITLYDHLADRWVMMQFAVSTVPSDLICIAVSTTADPLGSWYRYYYTWPNNYMPDYPKIGLWPDGYYLSAIQYDQAQTSWRGAGVVAMERSAMLTGGKAHAVYYNGYKYNDAYGGMLPADWEGTTPPPSGAPCPFVEWDDSAWIGPTNDELRIWNFHVDWTTTANSYFGASSATPFIPNATLATADVDPILCSRWPCIDQPATTQNLDELSDRLMHRVQYRNLGSRQAMVTNHTVDTNNPAGAAGIHWFELRDTGSGWKIYQQGLYGPDSASRWMGSIAMDQAGNMALGYSISSASIYPGIRYVGRLSTDPLGTMPQAEMTLVTGGGYQSDTYARWGDYSAMQVDPSDDCTFWYTQQYAKSSGGYNWYTRIGAFTFGSGRCGGPTRTSLPFVTR